MRDDEPRGHGPQWRDDAVIRRLLERIPDEVANSFTDDQLAHLKTALAGRSWGRHLVDLRATAAMPFLPWQLYVVFLCGRNRRQLSEGERQISALMTTLMVMLALTLLLCMVLGVLYLLKSALGINLFADFSLGIWPLF